MALAGLEGWLFHKAGTGRKFEIFSTAEDLVALGSWH